MRAFPPMYASGPVIEVEDVERHHGGAPPSDRFNAWLKRAISLAVESKGKRWAIRRARRGQVHARPGPVLRRSITHIEILITWVILIRKHGRGLELYLGIGGEPVSELVEHRLQS